MRGREGPAEREGGGRVQVQSGAIAASAAPASGASIATRHTAPESWRMVIHLHGRIACFETRSFAKLFAADAPLTIRITDRAPTLPLRGSLPPPHAGEGQGGALDDSDA